MSHIDRDSGDRSLVASIFLIMTCFVLGLLTGGMVVIGVSFVSFWKSLSPSDFQVWFASHSHRLGQLMIPSGVGGIAVTLAAMVACWRGSVTSRRWLLAAAGSTIGGMVTSPLFFEATNHALVRGGLSDTAARSLLDRWETWHWLRTGLGAFGFFAALRALHG